MALINKALNKGMSELLTLLETQAPDIYSAIRLTDDLKATVTMKILLEILSPTEIGVKVGLSYVKDKFVAETKTVVSEQEEMFEDKGA